MRALADQALTLVACAQRPLTVDEFRHAFAVELEEPELDGDNFADAEDIVSTCAGLVMIDQESGVVRFVHDTTREFFERLRPTKFQNGPRTLAEICLTYLSFDSFNRPCDTDDAFELRLVEYSLFKYAAQFWGFNARLKTQLDVQKQALTFLTHQEKVEGASQALFLPAYKYPGYSQDGPRNTLGIHLAAYFGLDVFVSHLIERGVDPDSNDSNKRTPLILAATHGHVDVVSLLLRNSRICINHEDVSGQTAIIWAAKGGHVEVLKMLVAQSGILVDHQDTDGRAALSWAAGEGHDAAVGILLAWPDVVADREDEEGRTPVWRAAKVGLLNQWWHAVA